MLPFTINAGKWPAFNQARIPPITFGPGSLDKVASLAKSMGERVLFVTGAHSLEASGALARLREHAKSVGLHWNCVTIEGEPETAAIDRIRDEWMRSKSKSSLVLAEAA